MEFDIIAFVSTCDYLAWGRESWSVCFSCIRLIIFHALIFFSSLWCLGLSAAYDCGTPGIFLLTFMKV